MKKWNVLSEYNPKIPVVNQILANRGIKDTNEFLTSPTTKYYFDNLPAELKKAFTEAKNLVEKAMDYEKPIVIYGDYDVDGVSSTSILYNTIKKELGYEKILFFIPSRFEHGYGLSEKALDDFKKTHKEDLKDETYLFITVDTGITAVKEIAGLKKAGHEVIIIDHHQKLAELPPADCIVWYDELVASAITWIFSKYLGSKDKKAVALAALATVTDVAPLLGFNRTIVKAGLEVMNSNPPLGILELMKVASRKDMEITTYDLGWVLGPRLNASGRLVDAQKSLSLFIEDDEAKVHEIAQELNSLNEDRQGKTLDMYDLAKNFEGETLPKIIFSENKDYHEGIIGLVAAKLTQKYYRPSIVVSIADGMGKGSVRSVKGFDVTAFLRKFEDLFVSLGGHPMAAGFSIEEKNITELKKRVIQGAEESLDESLLIPELTIDMQIPVDIVNQELLTNIEKMKPFGMGNDEPLFLSKSLGIAEINSMGKENQHARLKLYKDSKYYKAVIFDGAEKVKDLKFGELIDLVYTIKKNEYKGSVNIDLIVKDFRIP